MKPILFSKTETDFTTNGIGRLDCISCKVIEERNGMYELEAEIPITGLHASDIEMLSIIGVVPHDGGNVQAFVVYKITKPINGRFMVYARHISYRLSDIPCTPFSIESSPQACAQALAGLKSHAVETCPFNFITDVTTGNPYIQKTPASIRQRLGGVEGSILDQFGGEYEWDNFNISLLKQRGRLANTTGITLRYGKNITDINQEEEIANTVTGVVPFWIDTDGNNLVMLPEVVVYSENADNFPYHLTQTLDLSSEYQDKPTQAQLRTVAQMYVAKDGFGEPKVSIKVSFVDLWKSEEYKDIAPLERVQLCDEITVDFEKLGIKALAKVVKTDYDVLKERYNSIEVGSIRTTLAQAVTDRDKDIDTAFVQQLTRVSTAIADATAWLTSANGYVIAIKNTDGSWKELVFSDRANPYDQNAKILRINNNGIGFSTGGMSGIYKNAWTIDGVLNADFVKAGILGDVANKNFWNMVTGEFSLQAGATVGGKTVDAIAQEKANAAETAAEAVAAAALSAAVNDLQGQIDGNITSWFYSYAPTTSNAPASTWTTVDDKINHIGDLFYDSTTGYCYRWQIKTDAIDPAHPTANDFEWVRISDEDISEALSKAQTAQDTADGKRRVFISQPVPPYDIGDLWTVGTSGDILTCTTAKTNAQAYDAADWEKLNKYTDDTAVNNLNTSLTQQEIFNRLTNNGQTQGIYLAVDPADNITKLYINASFIKTGNLSADLITAGELKSANYQKTGYMYADAGFGLNLTNGSVITPNFVLSANQNYCVATRVVIAPKNAGDEVYLRIQKDVTNTAITENSILYSNRLLIYNGNSQEAAYYYNTHLQFFNNDTGKSAYFSKDYFYLHNSNFTFDITPSSLQMNGLTSQTSPYLNITDYEGNNAQLRGDMLKLQKGGTLNDYYVSVTYANVNRNRNGTQQAVSWSTSDVRVKEDIEVLKVSLSIKFIDKSEPKKFKYKNIEGKHYGMIAQSARTLLNELGEADAMLEHSMEIPTEETGIDDQRTIDYNEYIPHLINYVKDLRETVNRQQAEIDELKEIVKRLSV